MERNVLHEEIETDVVEVGGVVLWVDFMGG